MTFAPPFHQHRLVGSTSTELLVHSLAASLVHHPDSSPIRALTLIAGPQAGQDADFFDTTVDALRHLVANALADSTFKALLRRHPCLSVDGNRLTVRLPRSV